MSWRALWIWRCRDRGYERLTLGRDARIVGEDAAGTAMYLPGELCALSLASPADNYAHHRPLTRRVGLQYTSNRKKKTVSPIYLIFICFPMKDHFVSIGSIEMSFHHDQERKPDSVLKGRTRT